jgi:hypothetical protein
MRGIVAYHRFPHVADLDLQLNDELYYPPPLRSVIMPDSGIFPDGERVDGRVQALDLESQVANRSQFYAICHQQSKTMILPRFGNCRNVEMKNFTFVRRQRPSLLQEIRFFVSSGRVAP